MAQFRDNQKVFKDAWLKAKVEPGEYWEIGRSGFGLRVSQTGRKTFILAARYPGKAGGRRALGAYPVLSLQSAHAKADAWLATIERGDDPGVIEDRERAERLRQRDQTFAKVIEDFKDIKLAKERKGTDVWREIELDLMPDWKALPIAEISDDHVMKIIFRKAEKRRDQSGRLVGGKVGARNLLALIKRFFRWVVDRRIYGLDRTPCEGLSASKILGEDVTNSRERILTPDEIYAFWRATGEMQNPVGPAYRLLMLAALRLSEATKMQQRELDPLVLQGLEAQKNDTSSMWRQLPADRSIWTIPKERMKGKNSGKKQAREHVVPMTDDIVSLLAGLPKLGGPHLFSTTGGKVPVSIGTKVKAELDGRMLVVLRELAQSRGQDPELVELPHWVNHDIRRTVRSYLSELRVEEVVRERILAHARKGIEGTYDRHTYREEKRVALQLWAARLRTIVEPEPNNVIPIKALISA